MAAFQSNFVVCVLVVLLSCAAILIPTSAQLSSQKFYDEKCPRALAVIKSVVNQAIAKEPRMGASLLRLHFHDCFVNVSSMHAYRTASFSLQTFFFTH